MQSVLASTLILFAIAGSPDLATEATLYDRIAKAMAGRSDLNDLGKPAPELQRMRWMLGQWNVEAVVFATPTAPQRTEHGKALITFVNDGTWLQMADAYPAGNQDLGFLTYNIVSRRWISVGLDSVGNAVISTASSWEGNRLVLQAPHVEILGVVTTLRQTLSKQDDDHYSLLNEEQLPSGAWVKLDEYHYQRLGK